MFDILSDEIIEKIISFLKNEDVLNFAKVCKRFDNILKNSYSLYSLIKLNEKITKITLKLILQDYSI